MLLPLRHLRELYQNAPACTIVSGLLFFLARFTDQLNRAAFAEHAAVAVHRAQGLGIGGLDADFQLDEAGAEGL